MSSQPWCATVAVSWILRNATAGSAGWRCLVSFPSMYMIVPLRTDSFLQGDHVHLLQHGHNQGDIALKKQLCRTSRTLWAQTYLHARSTILAILSREISISSCIYKLLLIFLLFSTSLHVHILPHIHAFVCWEIVCHYYIFSCCNTQVW